MRNLVIASALAVTVVSRFALAADCRTRVVVDGGLTIVPFAVPVATPVAVINPGGVLYAATPPPVVASVPTAPANTSADAQTMAPSADELAEFRAWRAAKGNRANAATTLVARHCATCHSGAAPKGNLSLTSVLSPEVRLRAIHAVLEGAMPPGRPLASAEATRLLQELSSRPDAEKPAPVAQQ
jgi:hypothetical protein